MTLSSLVVDSLYNIVITQALHKPLFTFSTTGKCVDVRKCAIFLSPSCSQLIAKRINQRFFHPLHKRKNIHFYCLLKTKITLLIQLPPPEKRNFFALNSYTPPAKKWVSFRT